MDLTRITTLGTANTMLNHILNAESRYYDLSQQAASGLKVSKPSDDPSAAKSLINIKTQLNQLDGYLSNMSVSQNELNVLDDTMGNLTDLIDKATSLSTEAANGTYSEKNMDNIKVQIDQIIESVVDLANTQYNGTYIFAGTRTDTKPYSVTKDVSGNITAITYNGTPSTGDYKRYTSVSNGVNVAINTTGDQVFGSYSVASPTGIFGTLVNLSHDLGTYNQTNISSRLDELNNSLDTTALTRTKFASVSNKFELTQNTINTTITQLTSYKSDLEDADLAQILSDLTAQQTALNATYSVTSQLLGGTSLLNYM